MFTTLVRALDTAFVVGVLLNLSKLCELALRPHQQKKLQEWSEAKTIQLDDVRLPKWFQILRHPKAAGILLLIGLAEFVVTALVAGVSGNDVPRNVHIVQVIAILLGLLSMPYIFRRAGPKYLGWLFADQNALLFVGKYCLSILVGFVVLGVYQALLWLLIWAIFHTQTNFGDFFDGIANFTNPASRWLMFGLLLLWPFFTFFWIVIQVGGLAVWLLVLLALASIALMIVRGIAWRLVEYNKGVAAALSLIVTALIGIVDLAIRTHHPK